MKSTEAARVVCPRLSVPATAVTIMALISPLRARFSLRITGDARVLYFMRDAALLIAPGTRGQRSYTPVPLLLTTPMSL